MKNILEGRWLIKATERYANNGEWCDESSEMLTIVTFDKAELNQFSYTGVVTEVEDNQYKSVSTYLYFPSPQNRLHINKAVCGETKIYHKNIYDVEPVKDAVGYYLYLINNPDNSPPYLRFLIVPAE